MKIEKINDNQIRCTLTKEDLASRQLKLSELAYGTEKAKRLFREMMQQANFEFGFEAQDIPLMIEAIPMNAECVVLLITKVEDPEELDTRFARFSPNTNLPEDEDDEEPFDGYPGDVPDAIRPFTDPLRANVNNDAPAEDNAKPTRIFLFRTLSEVMTAAAQIGKNCACPTALYKDAKGNGYLLTVNRANASPEDYAKVCNLLSEYGKVCRNQLSDSFIKEHYEVILAAEAIQNLAF